MFTAEDAKVIPLQERADDGRVRGALIQVHVDWLRDYGARDEIIDLFESLHANLRHQVLAAQPAHWYRFHTLVQLQVAMCSRLGDGGPRFVERVGAYAAQKQLLPLRSYLRSDSIHDFMRTTAVLHHDHLDFGSSDYVALSEDAGRMLVAGLSSSPTHRAFLSGFYREAIVQHGAHEPAVNDADGRSFDFFWR